MPEWTDYYELLQVRPDADREIIEVAYRKLAQRYHPDVNKDPSASIIMAQLNVARDILTDSLKRSDYDLELKARGPGRAAGSGGVYTDSRWSGGATAGGKTAGDSSYAHNKSPRPVASPRKLRLAHAIPGRHYQAFFVLRNEGGPFGRIRVDVPNTDKTWLVVTGAESIENTGELPMRVMIDVVTDGRKNVYNGTVYVALDESVTEVDVIVLSQPASSGSTEWASVDGSKSNDASPGMAAAASGLAKKTLSLGKVVLGMLLLIPGVVWEYFALSLAINYFVQNTPDKVPQVALVLWNLAIAFVLVVPGTALLRSGLSGNAVQDKWWKLSFKDIKDDDRWWLPFILGAIGGFIAWFKVKAWNSGIALKMLTWGMIVSLLQPIIVMLLSLLTAIR